MRGEDGARETGAYIQAILKGTGCARSHPKNENVLEAFAAEAGGVRPVPEPALVGGRVRHQTLRRTTTTTTTTTTTSSVPYNQTKQQIHMRRFAK